MPLKHLGKIEIDILESENHADMVEFALTVGFDNDEVDMDIVRSVLTDALFLCGNNRISIPEPTNAEILVH